MSLRPSPFDNPNGRQSPFRRQNSASPATVRAATPTTSPTKASSPFSLNKVGSLSPEKSSPFVRKPSQINANPDRPTSPFAKPSSSLSTQQNSSHPLSDVGQEDSTPRLQRELDTPVVAPLSPSTRRDEKSSLPEEIFAGDSPSMRPSHMANLRSVAQRTPNSSAASTPRPPVFTSQAKQSIARPPKIQSLGGGAYNHISEPLLRSMRESFEVLDSNNVGTVNSAAVAEMLSQLGLDNTTAALKDFYPPSAPASLNLARYLDILSGPLVELSQPDELRAAFEAFDVDDSGQIDVSTLRDALLHTAPQPGDDMIRLSEREVDKILAEFSGRRAFGSKGINATKAKSEVFKYRDFMGSVSGGGANSTEPEVALAA